MWVQVSGLGRLQLTKAIYNFTDTQDIRLRIGYEAFVDQKGYVIGVRLSLFPGPHA